MAIQFNPDRWAQVRETYTKWWDGSLKRPIFQVTQRIGTGPDPHPHVPVLSQATCADFSWTPEEVIDKIDWQLSGNLYHGDAYPVVSLSAFGPGIVAAMVGGKLDNSSGAVWFYPKDGTESIHDIHVEFDPHNRWLSRIKDLWHQKMAGQCSDRHDGSGRYLGYTGFPARQRRAALRPHRRA